MELAWHMPLPIFVCTVECVVLVHLLVFEIRVVRIGALVAIAGLVIVLISAVRFASLVLSLITFYVMD